MGQQIEIQTEIKYLIPGEQVTVPIVVNFEKRTKVKNITARFFAAERAEAKYKETKTDSKGKRTTKTKTAVAHHKIAEEDYLLKGEPPMGCMASIGDFFASLVGAGKGTHIEAGRHEFSVSFQIPPDAPPSIEGKKCRIFYELSVRVNRPLATDFRAEHKFEVAPTVEMLQGESGVAYYPDEDGRSFWDRTFGKDARLTLAVKNDVYTPGDKVLALFQAESDSPIHIKSIMAKLICVESTSVRSHTDSAIHTTEPITIAAAQELVGGFSSELLLEAESIGPPTTSGENFKVRWYIEVTMDVPWAADPVIRLPIRIVGST